MQRDQSIVLRAQRDLSIVQIAQMSATSLSTNQHSAFYRQDGLTVNQPTGKALKENQNQML